MKKRILCFGDSNTWGYDTETLERFDEDTRWTYKLSEALGDDYIVIEEGQNGRTSCFDDPLDPSKNGSHYLVPCLQTHDPLDLMVLMIGTNDLKQRYAATAKNIAESIQRLVKMAQHTEVWKNEPKILLVAPIIVGKEYEKALYGENLGAGCHEKSVLLVKYVKMVAEENECYYMDANDFVTATPIDWLHIDKKSQLPFAIGVKAKVMKILG